MNRRCALCWVAALISIVVSATVHYRGGGSGVDGLFFVIALAWALLAIQAHQPTGWRT
ncbi:hypothetical protein [Tsukamurella paurometabola]|uniref:Uncharacterized protein n=1 Tax=Tsukamurella paurometabola TaxID=2061 RepID=A0A3P8MAN0_TSUPA|nr:hypothetical protein [Tsukamurella paurometabola]MBS4103811.1 hypothetical protein [Tsukamurella paurometabola]UEA81383.1 hypothetical protein LK411_13285 [Tsukamurella paurometabola]VDR38370.1 Uncharacterised protein [Tsukamurella paurometabola]